MPLDLTFRSVTPETWPDFEAFFRAGDRTVGGDVARCWCMEWRMPLAEWRDNPEAAHRGMRDLVLGGGVPGFLAYEDGAVVGWCSVAPRATLRVRRRGLVRADEPDEGVWSIICFYVPQQHHGRGLMTAMLEHAVAYAAENGARIVEGYSTRPGQFQDMGYTGRLHSFEKAGFTPVDEPTPGVVVMQRRL